MQKIRLQIMVDYNDLNALHRFQEDNECVNESHAVHELLKAYKGLNKVIKQLEKISHGVEKCGIEQTDITAKDVKKNTDTKQKSGENISDMQKPKGGG